MVAVVVDMVVAVWWRVAECGVEALATRDLEAQVAAAAALAAKQKQAAVGGGGQVWRGRRRRGQRSKLKLVKLISHLLK